MEIYYLKSSANFIIADKFDNSHDNKENFFFENDWLLEIALLIYFDRMKFLIAIFLFIQQNIFVCKGKQINSDKEWYSRFYCDGSSQSCVSRSEWSF